MTHRHIHENPQEITFAAIEEIAADEETCLAFLEACRFPNSLRCPVCDAAEDEGDQFTRHRSRRGLFTCAGCRRQFTLTSGTAMHRTRLPLGQGLRAIWLVVASSKGLSARKLGEMLGVTYKVAWHMGHRTQSMMAHRHLQLDGTVELNEICAGAAPRKRHGGGPTGVRSGRLRAYWTVRRSCPIPTIGMPSTD